MAANIAHVGASILCPHGGTIRLAPGSPRVKVSGQPVATAGDTSTVAGCSFTLPSAKPQPCIRAQWTVTSARVKSSGQPLILSSSTGLCLSAEQIPQGAPVFTSTQTRVKAT